MTWVITPAQKTDPDALSYLAEVERADGQALESGVRDAVIAFVSGCKADGIWSAIKASCILAGARTLAGALVPLVGKAPTNISFVGADYARKTGLKGDGSTKFLNANRNRTDDPQNSCHFAAYRTEAESSGKVSWVMGAGSGGGGAGVTHYATGSVRILRNTCNQSAGTNVPGLGLVGSNRSSLSTFTFYSANQKLSVVRNSDGRVNASWYIFHTDSIAYSEVSDARMSFYSIGESLDLALLDARVTDLINAIGAAIP